MLDPNGANTTAAAAVLAASQSLGAADMAGATATVLAGTGPVGRRIARLLSRYGATVRVASRQADKAAKVAADISAVTGKPLTGVGTGTPNELSAAVAGADLVFAAGAAGITLLPAAVRRAMKSLKVAVDLNAVPPLGLEGVDATDKGADRDGAKCWGALGVGGLKMKIHKAAIARLFEANDRFLDAEEMVEIGRGL
jgi:glutamyl-tRNA reductase